MSKPDGQSLPPPEDAGAVVRFAFERGATAWPDIGLPFEAFEEMASEAGAMTGLAHRPEEFFLACAAGNGIETAIAVIDRDCLKPAASRIRRLGAPKEAVEDALQLARERLFVGPVPKIRAYAAAVPLKHWVRVVALRTAIDFHRSREGQPSTFEVLNADDLPAASDPVRTILKRHYQASVEAALGTELASLPPNVRTVLRLHFLEGITIEKLAAREGVHRVTVARWIWNAADRVLQGVRRHLVERVGLPEYECDSVIRLVQSQLTLDLSRAFAE